MSGASVFWHYSAIKCVGQEQAKKINRARVRHGHHELQRTAFVVDPKWVIVAYVRQICD